MKLYLASYLETHNFGEGRIINIANGDKPDHVECDLVFPHLIPSKEITIKYRDESLKDYKKAGPAFVKSFKEELELFVKDVEDACKEDKKNPQEILPFKENDTLASWERKHFNNYRGYVAECLEKLGYEVVLN